MVKILILLNNMLFQRIMLINKNQLQFKIMINFNNYNKLAIILMNKNARNQV